MAEATATPFEFKLADGSVVKAENIEEAFKTVAKMKEDTAAALKSERAERETLAGQVASLQAQVTQRNTPPPDANAFNRDTYYKLVGDDPIMAQNYLDAYRYGIADPAQVPQYFQDTFATVNNLQQQTLAATFVNMHPEFPPSNETAEILTKEVIKLRQEGHPVNMNTMEIAYQNCVASEKIKPLEPEEEKEDPNPSPGGGGAGVLDAETTRIEADVASGKMSMADFEKFLASKGMFSGGGGR